MEVVVLSLKVSKQNDLNHQEYSKAIIKELEALDVKRLQALDHIMIQKRRWLGLTTSWSEKRALKKGSSFGRWYCPSMLKIENWGNGLLFGRDHSRFTKYFLEIPIGYQALKGSHTKGSSIGSTSRNTFLQCGKCWTLPRKTKVENKKIISKIGPIDHFWIGETIPSTYFE